MNRLEKLIENCKSNTPISGEIGYTKINSAGVTSASERQLSLNNIRVLKPAAIPFASSSPEPHEGSQRHD
jgi:hypothetical protein